MKHYPEWFPEGFTKNENSDFNLNGILDKDELKDWTFPSIEYVFK